MRKSKRFSVTFNLDLNDMIQCLCQELRSADRPGVELRFLTRDQASNTIRQMLNLYGQSYAFRDGHDFMIEDVIAKLEELFPELANASERHFQG